MSKPIGLMQQALGEDWHLLPAALQAHYAPEDNSDVGELTVEYPRWMTPYYFLLSRMGALIHRQGTSTQASVHKSMQGERQYWHRHIRFDERTLVNFDSVWELAGNKDLIEYVNPFMGLRMRVCVVDGKLLYAGVHFILVFGGLKIPLPEWLVLGHTSIVEQAHEDGSFSMDFRLRHPWFGELYGYYGRFRTHSKAE